MQLIQKKSPDRTAVQPFSRWWALGVLCLGSLMIVLDSTIVTVALPSIRADLHLSNAALVWVVNGYLLTFGGFLLLGGRLGDFYGQRKLFLYGIAIFTIASLACGYANSSALLIGARALQGLGGAVVSAVALSLIMSLFRETRERAKSIGVYGFVSAGGGSLGLLLGGTLTSTFSWRWIFLVNLPIGAAVYALGRVALPHCHSHIRNDKLDLAGAILVTSAAMVAVYAIVNSNAAGWASMRTLAMLGMAATILCVFLRVETRVPAPIIPLELFRVRTVAVANVAGVFIVAAMFVWCFIAALYLQLVLEYSPLQVGVAFLPANLITAMCSLGLSARVVIRFGVKPPLVVGSLLLAAGLLLFARAPLGGTLSGDVLPGMLLLGIGSGMTFNPLLLAAMSGVAQDESGLASGLVNTSFLIGGAVGLAVAASIAAARTDAMLASGSVLRTALNDGYHIAFLIGTLFALTAASLIGALLDEDRDGPRREERC